MGRRRPDWWSEQQQKQQHQHKYQQDQYERRQDQAQEFLTDDDGCPRNAANARERARMRVLSKAFSRLKTTLPWVPADTKLSKLDTLRLATTYIAHLSSLLAASEQPDDVDAATATATPVAVTSSYPSNYAATWPYNVYNSAKQCSSLEDDYQYDCYNALEQKSSSYSGYDSYCTSSVN